MCFELSLCSARAAMDLGRGTLPKKRRKKVKKSIVWRLILLGRKNIWLTLLFLIFAGNFSYQVALKPTEILSLVASNAIYTPSTTWSKYGDEFVENRTQYISPYLLASFAQVESGGNPWVSPGWVFNWRRPIHRIYAPASSSVGLMQFTEGTYQRARKLCVHKGQVFEDGPWYDFKSCWGNFLYHRVWPGHAIEMTSAYLHRSVESLVRRFPQYNFSSENVRKVAAVTHLCGIGVAKRVIRQRFKITSDQTCGSHNLSRYVDKISRLSKTFRRLHK